MSALIKLGLPHIDQGRRQSLLRHVCIPGWWEMAVMSRDLWLFGIAYSLRIGQQLSMRPVDERAYHVFAIPHGPGRFCRV